MRFVYFDALCRPAGYLLHLPPAKLLRGSYCIKMVFEQVPTCFRQLLEAQAWIFSMGRLEGGKLVAWGVGGRSPALPSPGKYPSGMLLPKASKKHHHHFFPDKFFLWYLPLTGPLGVQQQQKRVLPRTATARGTLRSYENIPTHTVTGSWKQNLSLVQNQAPPASHRALPGHAAPSAM